ncbi:MAG TPA: glycosyltransferase family A protein [Vicinamibacterales bacterium]|nr:glycosyltransferase family A protein [Vicinamibacterales bacterium]
MALTISVIVCAYNEASYLPACLHSLFAQTRIPDQVIVVDNASTDRTAALARRMAGVEVVNEPRKGLVSAREAGRRHARGDVLVYLDADCRAPIWWLDRIERRFASNATLVGLSGPYRFYDWDVWGRLLVRTYDVTLAPATQLLVSHLLHLGAVFYGGNFAARRGALASVGGFDTTIEFHGEDTNIGRRLRAVGPVALCNECFLYTSARRYVAMGKKAVFGLYIRNFTSELLWHRPSDTTHVDVRL